MTKKCTKCLRILPLNHYYKDKLCKGGLGCFCKDCIKLGQKAYYRTYDGYFTFLYSSQKQSCKRRGHPFPTYTKQEIRERCLSQENWELLRKGRVSSGYQKQQKPSVDRIDDSKSYSLENIQLIKCIGNEKKQIEKSLLGNNESITYCPVAQFSKSGELIARYRSQKQASKYTGVGRSEIGKCCNGKAMTAGGFVWEKCDMF